MGEKAIGDLIAKYRKHRGMTQEELGKKIGVTTQAVSRWECGGTPDIFLLPAIADTLGVNIDALFGRNTGEAVDLKELMYNRVIALPREQQLEYISEVFWIAIKAIANMKDMKYLERSMEKVMTEKAPMWMRSCVLTEYGMALGVPAEDFHFWGVFPEPKAGFASYISSDNEYQKLFQVLGRPGCFSVLKYLYNNGENYYIAITIAKRLGLELDESELILSELEEVNLLRKRNLELEDKTVPAYIVHNNGGFIPFLIFARWFMEKNDSWVVGWDTRKTPYIHQEVQKNEK
ncbi:helix-turn-helix domain-containing protein [Alloiococcus sp. CFN-8]|uniref:helix-turn-helix domain-containing protein n=1 Tax=Alloiococcus sp. CFN-8 TaxID=3416081 RepID=UPI003CE680E5